MRALVLLVGALSLCSGQHGVPLPPLVHTETLPNTAPTTFSTPEGLPPTAPQHPGVPLIDYNVSNKISDNAPLLGAVRPVGVDDSDVRRLAAGELVRARTQKDTTADSAVKISEVISAHKQVVSGQIVYLTLRVHETLCPVGAPDLTSCLIDETEDPYLCEIAVWERPWLNSSKIVDEKTRCAEMEDDNDFDAWRDYNNLHSPVTFSGYQTVVQELPNGLDEDQLAFEAFNYVNVGSESKFRGHLVNHNIEQIMYDPVLNLTNVRMNVEYGFTLCLKSLDNKIDGRVCLPDTGRDHYICGVTIVDNPNEIVRLQVNPDDDDDILCKRKVAVEEELVIPVEAHCLGCPQPAPMSDPTILDMADFALKEYDRISDEEELHMIVRLIKAQTQVVAGIKYILTVEIVDTDCHKANVGVDVNRTFCQQDFTDTSEICDLHIVEQSWVPSKDLVYSKCYDRDQYPGSSNGELSANSKDEFIVPVLVGSSLGSAPIGGSANKPLLGGEKPAVIDAKMLEIAEIVVEEYDRREDDDNYHKIVKVHQVSSQVVSGKKYRFVVEIGETYCHKRDPSFTSRANCQFDPTEEHEMCIAEVHEQPWLQTSDSRRILSLYCDDLDDYLRKMANPHLSHFQEFDRPFFSDQGTSFNSAQQQQNVNDPKVREAASFVVDQYNLKEDDDNLYILSKVISAQVNNVEGGSRYMIEVELAETYCKKYLPVADPSRCRIDHDEDHEVCQAEVLVPATAGEKQLVKLYCDDADDYYIRKFAISALPAGAPTLATNLVGHWVGADINTPEVKQLAIVVASEFDLRSDEDNVFKLHKLLNAKQQVQNGMNYHLVVELAETLCPKYKPGINKTNCPIDIGEEHMICEATVWVQSWRGKREVTDMRCADQDDFYEGDESKEILYPRVHPTAHARPIFYNHFRDNSRESRESDEYGRSRSSNRSNQQFDSEEDDSDERLFRGALFRRQTGGITQLVHPAAVRNQRNRGRRSGPGMISDSNVSAEKALELAQFGVESVDNLSEDPRRRMVEEVLEIREQVVAGKMWHLTVRVTWTKCTKESGVQLSSCEPDPAEPKYICKFRIWEKVWENFRKVQESTCEPASQKA